MFHFIKLVTNLKNFQVIYNFVLYICPQWINGKKHFILTDTPLSSLDKGSTGKLDQISMRYTE